MLEVLTLMAGLASQQVVKPLAPAATECVVLLHGLARSDRSMKRMEKTLATQGYEVANIGYDSRSAPVEELAIPAVQDGVDACIRHQPTKIHLVTHSLGGILVRYYLARKVIENLGHVVMLGPPNQGSHVVDNWRRIPGFRLLNGPAGMQLGTDPDSVPRQLGPVSFSLGVIAGTRSMNPILSLSLPNPDDGKVHVENTKVEGMSDFIEVPHTHTFMMRAPDVLSQVLHFLRYGRFIHAGPTSNGP
ncbi:MAG: alpha/beta hydrolase [Pseudomonadota bacterium]